MPEERFHRRSIRLPKYDYAQAGLYYVTICTHERALPFGNVMNGKMQLTILGQIVHEEWLRTAEVRKHVVLDKLVVMPNHVHVLFWIVDDLIGRDMRAACPDRKHTNQSGDTPSACPYGVNARRFGNSVPGSVSTIMRQYKSLVTKQINRIRNTPGKPIRQRNFYERVVRDEREANNTRRYIVENPMRWHLDRYNPDIR